MRYYLLLAGFSACSCVVIFLLLKERTEYEQKGDVIPYVTKTFSKDRKQDTKYVKADIKNTLSQEPGKAEQSKQPYPQLSEAIISALEKFAYSSPHTLSFDVKDNVAVQLKNNVTKQLITLYGTYRMIFWKKEWKDEMDIMVTNISIHSTPLLIPGIGAVELKIERDLGNLSFAELDLSTCRFKGDMYIKIDVPEISKTKIPMRFKVEGDFIITPQGVISLSFRGGSTAPDDVPVFGGAVFSLVHDNTYTDK